MATQEEISFSLLILLGTIGMFLLALGVVFFFINYKKKLVENELEKEKIVSEYHSRLANSIIETQEEERKRFAADLHDQIGASLSTARLQVALIERKADDKPKTILISKEVQKILDDVIQDVRRISKDLVPPVLEEFGLFDAVNKLAGRISDTEKLNVECTNLNHTLPRLEKRAELSVYRIIQEVLNNSIKHSGATKITIEFTNKDKKLYISITDNGKGFDPKKLTLNNGIGLNNIKSRIRLLSGTYALESSIGSGTTWNFVLPLIQ